jgi:hypothetical protein
MRKKYQVFISSTYTDLIEDRQTAVEAVLDAGHIPAGMELFKSGKSQMETIYKWIDESDIYMLILGGRYGSIERESGKSYTQLEYEYALKKGMPVFAVVLSDEERARRVAIRGEAVIETLEGRKYIDFKELVLSKVSGFYHNMDGIKSEVHKQLNNIKENNNLVGWIKADDESIKLREEELIRIIHSLKLENEKLNKNLKISMDEKLIPLPMDVQLKRLKDFFDSKGVEISYNSREWSVFSSSTPDSYGAPREWGDNPAIFLSKRAIKYGFEVEGGLRYAFCPTLNKGAKIITENNYFKIVEIY